MKDIIKEKINNRICIIAKEKRELLKDYNVCWVLPNNEADIIIDCDNLSKQQRAIYKYRKRNIIINNISYNIDKLFYREHLDKYIRVRDLATLICAPLIAGGAKKIILYDCLNMKDFKKHFLRYSEIFNNAPDIYNASDVDIKDIRKVSNEDVVTLLKGGDLNILRSEGWTLI